MRGMCKRDAMVCHTFEADADFLRAWIVCPNRVGRTDRSSL